MGKNDRELDPRRASTSTGSSRWPRPLPPALAAIEAAAEGRIGIPIVDRDAAASSRSSPATGARIVEVGTAYGYSTLWLALGQPADGTIVTIDPDRERTDLRPRLVARGRDRRRADHGRQRAGARGVRGGDPALAGPFDMVFIDALKPEYLAYLEALVGRLAPGALVAADNVLWSGRVVGQPAGRGRRREHGGAARVRRGGPRRPALHGHDPAPRRRAAHRRPGAAEPAAA